MKEIIYIHKTKIIIGTIGFILFLGFLWSKHLSSENTLPQATLEIEGVFGETETEIEAETEDETNTKEQPFFILVDIKGAVQMPGVYELQSNNRVIDAVEKAGGFLENADTRKVNLASLLVDEMVIYVPEEGEEIDESQLTHSVTSTNEKESVDGAKININTATEEELTKISGVGPAKAKAIVTYRTENGLFKSIEEIVNVSGIGAKSLEKIKNEITTSN
ncbi:helix-hairpin-helix domain-containing protein [Sutcliffiella halmapala]|uniref:helix-hairpin-helix domain-containing protein n=1 Tax=Sutcliffiella halmapala TaxID=79882 RepID=UPI000995A509|nr:helix-hairpin-helix domain-containing protein [Sutcliffiella halmapala]